MFLHVHQTDRGDEYVAHISRDEAVNLIKNLSETMANNEEANNFSLSLGQVASEEEVIASEGLAGE